MKYTDVSSYILMKVKVIDKEARELIPSTSLQGGGLIQFPGVPVVYQETQAHLVVGRSRQMKTHNLRKNSNNKRVTHY